VPKKGTTIKQAFTAFSCKELTDFATLGENGKNNTVFEIDFMQVYVEFETATVQLLEVKYYL
jgi:hypothetical protein